MLPGARVVVRAGLMLLSDLRTAVVSAMRDPTIRRYEITVYVGAEGETAADVARRVPDIARRRSLRQSTVAALREIGIELVDCDSEGHCQVAYDTEPEDGDLLALAGAFRDAEENPAFKGSENV